MYSFQVFREFPGTGEKVKMAFEFGPSFISYHLIEFTRRNPVWIGSKYEKTDIIKQSAGLSASFNINILLLRWMGFDASVFTNINPLQSFVGFEIYLNLGLIRR